MYPRGRGQAAATRRRFRENAYSAAGASALPLGVSKTEQYNGEWIGHYPGHFDEVVKIQQNGEDLEAVKITGDDYVPAGAVTWRANLRTLRGEGQIAEREFVRPRFIPGELRIVNEERIIFRWESCGEVEFRKDE